MHIFHMSYASESNIPGMISYMRSTLSKSEKRLFNKCKEMYTALKLYFCYWKKKALKDQSVKALLKEYIKKA